MKAGVLIERWKMLIFKRHLDAAGYKYTEHPGLSVGTVMLHVECEWAHKLQPIVEAAHRECKATGKPTNEESKA